MKDQQNKRKLNIPQILAKCRDNLNQSTGMIFGEPAFMTTDGNVLYRGGMVSYLEKHDLGSQYMDMILHKLGQYVPGAEYNEKRYETDMTRIAMSLADCAWNDGTKREIVPFEEKERMGKLLMEIVNNTLEDYFGKENNKVKGAYTEKFTDKNIGTSGVNDSMIKI